MSKSKEEKKGKDKDSTTIFAESIDSAIGWGWGTPKEEKSDKQKSTWSTSWGK